jgi:hypothetical protein
VLLAPTMQLHQRGCLGLLAQASLHICHLCWLTSRSLTKRARTTEAHDLVVFCLWEWLDCSRVAHR